MDNKTTTQNEEFTAFEKEFKIQLNMPLTYFTVFYFIYLVYMVVTKNFKDLPVVAISGALIFLYFYGFRPSKYVIKRRTLEIQKRIGKPREVNLMDVETISDPVAKMTKLITNAHSYEIYLNDGKRIVVAPKDQMEFVDAIVRANKRIHCQVEEYNQTHRKWEKKRRKEEKQARRSEMRAKKKSMEE